MTATTVANTVRQRILLASIVHAQVTTFLPARSKKGEHRQDSTLCRVSQKAKQVCKPHCRLPHKLTTSRRRSKMHWPALYLVDGLIAASHAVLELFIIRLSSEALLIGLEGILVLLHEELDVALAAVALGKGRCQPDALIRILEPCTCLRLGRENCSKQGLHARCNELCDPWSLFKVG